MKQTGSTAFRIEELAPGVHAAIAEAGGDALSNSTIVDLGDATVVFDSMLTPHAGAELGRAARRLTGRPPDFVVDSHYHHDHVWGNGAVAPLHVIATRRTRDLLARRGRDQFLSIRREVRKELHQLDATDSPVPVRDRPFFRGWYRGIARMPPGFTARVPDMTMETELTLHGSRRTLRLISRGGGHSPSDLFGIVEDHRIGMMGDLVFVGMHPSAGDGYPSEWIRILRAIRRIGPQRIVPGHGPVGGDRDVARVQEYLRDILRLVRRAETLGEPLSSIAVPPKYRAWTGTPFFASNLARVRTQLRREARPRATG